MDDDTDEVSKHYPVVFTHGHICKQIEKEPGEDIVTIMVVDGALSIRDDLKEYADRGSQLHHMNLLEFFLDTYETDAVPLSTSNRGRKPSERVPYMEGTGHGQKCRVIRRDGHETMPNFIGDWFPRNDLEEVSNIYYASMLALLRPWRDIGDLKMQTETFKEAFDAFVAVTDDRTADILANIQYQHECSNSAAKKRARERETINIVGVLDHEQIETVCDDELNTINHNGMAVQWTQKDVEHLIASKFSLDDKLYAEVALNIAMDHRIFDEDGAKSTLWQQVAQPASNEQMVQYQTLERLVKNVTKDCITLDRTEELDPTVQEGLSLTLNEEATVTATIPLRDDCPHLNRFGLNVEQWRAHDIIINHLKMTLAGRSPPQLLVNIIGQGGTGKSTLLNAITSTFEVLNASHLLKKTALSGVAASLIGGTMLHWFAGLPVNIYISLSIGQYAPAPLTTVYRHAYLITFV